MFVSEFGYSTSDTVSISVSKYSNGIFIVSTSNRILSGIVKIIRIRIRIKQKYENKCNISVIRSCSYLIRFHT
jgi:hypothetical protein